MIAVRAFVLTPVQTPADTCADKGADTCADTSVRHDSNTIQTRLKHKFDTTAPSVFAIRAYVRRKGEVLGYFVVNI